MRCKTQQNKSSAKILPVSVANLMFRFAHIIYVSITLISSLLTASNQASIFSMVFCFSKYRNSLTWVLILEIDTALFFLGFKLWPFELLLPYTLFVLLSFENGRVHCLQWVGWCLRALIKSFWLLRRTRAHRLRLSCVFVAGKWASCVPDPPGQVFFS